MKKRPSNRKGKAGGFSGSAMRLLDRVSAWLEKSYVEQQAYIRTLCKSAIRGSK